MSEKTKQVLVVIDENTSQLRLDKALSLHPEVNTRSRAAKLIHVNAVLLNDKPVKASHKTRLGECFKVLMPINEEQSLNPYNFPLNILFEDADLLVLDKPSGLVVHPAQGHQKDTLVNALIHRGTQLSKGSHKMRPGIVHRLDKDTSGTIVVAKNDISHLHLSQQFKNKTVIRSYWAIIFGQLPAKEGTISKYLARHPKDRKKYASVQGRANGKLSVTHYKTLKIFPPGLTLIKCNLETGRTHQIRIHMSEEGHPIIGDPIYGGHKAIRRVRSQGLKKLLSQMDRIGLHAFELGFDHPKTGETMYFKSDWPDNLKNILTALNRTSHKVL